MIAIITGSGLYEIEGLMVKEDLMVDTPFGSPSGAVRKCTYKGHEVLFLPRHGIDHSIPPHKVNYRGNIRALKDLGVERIISVSAVGGISREIPPGSFVLADQIIDMTRSRANTFFEGDDVVHVDFTEPYCEDMRRRIIKGSDSIDIRLTGSGTYVAVEGPRLETAAEIEMYRMAGADIVGMTAMPEAVLAREAEICYSGIYIVTNYAAGIKDGRLTTGEVVENMRRSSEKIKEFIGLLVPLLDTERVCSCNSALKNARL